MGDGVFERYRVLDVEAGAYAEYRYTVEDVSSSPVEPGDHIVRLEPGETYRSLASGRLYTIAEITGGIVPTARYHYDRDGERVEREDPVMLLGVVEPDTRGGDDA